MRLLKYLTVAPSYTYEGALSLIRRELRESQFYANESPHKLSGNQKVLKLISRQNIEDFVKVDGPGFIIDKLYEYFIMK